MQIWNLSYSEYFWLKKVGREFTNRVDLERLSWKAPDFFPSAYTGLPSSLTHRDAVINACVYVHQTLHKANARLAKRGGRTMSITPRYYFHDRCDLFFLSNIVYRKPVSEKWDRCVSGYIECWFLILLYQKVLEWLLLLLFYLFCF